MTKQLKGIHVFAIIAGFFLVTFSVNGVFIWRAVTTFPGEQVEKSYLQGLDYNRTLARKASQAELGWGAEIGIDPSDAGQLLVRVKDDAGSPVGNLEVSVIQRAYGESAEQRFLLTSVEPGVYAAPLAANAKRVELTVKASRRGEREVVFVAHKTLSLS